MCAPAKGAPIEVVLLWVNHDAGGVAEAPTLTRDTQNLCRAIVSFSLTQIDRPEYRATLVGLLREENKIRVVGVLFKRDIQVRVGKDMEETLCPDHDRTALLLGELRREFSPGKIVVVSTIRDLSPKLAGVIDGRMTHQEFQLLPCSKTSGSPEHFCERSAA